MDGKMTFDGPKLARAPANHTALFAVAALKRVMRAHRELPRTTAGKTRKKDLRDLVRQKR